MSGVAQNASGALNPLGPTPQQRRTARLFWGVGRSHLLLPCCPPLQSRWRWCSCCSGNRRQSSIQTNEALLLLPPRLRLLPWDRHARTSCSPAPAGKKCRNFHAPHTCCRTLKIASVRLGTAAALGLGCHPVGRCETPRTSRTPGPAGNHDTCAPWNNGPPQARSH